MVDGDVFALKDQIRFDTNDRRRSRGFTGDGQYYRRGYGPITLRVSKSMMADGPSFYCIGKRNSHSLDFERIIPARYITAHGFYSRNDMTRGIYSSGC